MNSDEPDNHESQTPSITSVLTLPAIFLIGLIIYEVTNDPAMAAMAMCIKFGWEDFRTAIWLKMRDPDGGRGAACCWLYVASGLWQTAIIGIAMVLLTVALSAVIPGAQQGPGPVLSLLSGAGRAILFGFVFSTVATYFALGYAHRHGVRPWLNGALHIARRNNQWPPLYGHRNRIIILVLTTIIVTFVVLVPVFILIGAAILQHARVPEKLITLLLFIMLLFFYLILLPASIVVVINLNRQRFFAEHPADCWGEQDPHAARNSEIENEELNA